MGEVWDRDLHFVDLIKVRLRFIEYIVVEQVSNVAIPRGLIQRHVIATTVVDSPFPRSSDL